MGCGLVVYVWWEWGWVEVELGGVGGSGVDGLSEVGIGWFRQSGCVGSDGVWFWTCKMK